MSTDHQRVIEAGCDACFFKPVNFKSLGEQLERWLNHTARVPPRQ
jgi:hypothetical protein